MRVALTFDAEHPDRSGSGGKVRRLLAGLGDRPATFFLQGAWAYAHPDDARAIVAAGHRVGNHSHHHAPATALTPDGLRADVRRAETAITEVTGADPRPWFRCWHFFAA